MVAAEGFSARLTLALKALSMSRGRLAAELGVDKSLIGRWASGAVRPSDYNLERLTRFLAEQRPGLTLLDWERDLADFAQIFGVDPAVLSTGGETRIHLPLELMDEAAHNSAGHRGQAYEGFWRATHAAVFAPGQFCHQHGLIRREAGGLLHMRLGCPGLRLDGTLLPVEGQVFSLVTDTARHLPSFLILNVIPMAKVILLDGLLVASGNAMRAPTAYAIVFERIGDLSGDREADDAHACALMERQDFVDDRESIPQVMREHLLRDFGPAAAASGGDLLMTAGMNPTLSRLIAHVGAERGGLTGRSSEPPPDVPAP